MRLKFLSVIASILLLSFSVASCLGDNETPEYPIDSTIWAFGLDAIYGVHYKFTIDQVRGKIYNLDSVPFSADTIINRILVDTLMKANTSLVWTGDTLFNQADSVDFSNSMYEPIKFKVVSYVDDSEKSYEIEVRRHLQDPDLFVWSKTAETFSGTANYGEQKTVIFGDQLFIYNSYQSFYSSAITDGVNWTLHSNVTGLPADLKLSSMLVYGENLYAISSIETGGKLYSSGDGVTWTETSFAGIVALLASFPEGISAVVEDGGVKRFALSDIAVTAWDINTGETVPDDFPVENISSLFQTMPTGITRTVLAGKSEGEKTVPWFSYEGKTWAAMDNLSTTNVLPPMEEPTILFYNGKLHAFGGDFTKIYTSNDGLVWTETGEKFQLKEEFKDRKGYSAVVDERNFIWIVWDGETGSYTNQVWRGRLNKLGFQ